MIVENITLKTLYNHWIGRRSRESEAGRDSWELWFFVLFWFFLNEQTDLKVLKIQYIEKMYAFRQFWKKACIHLGNWE